MRPLAQLESSWKGSFKLEASRNNLSFFCSNCCVGRDTIDCVYLETELVTSNKGFFPFQFRCDGASCF